MGNSNALIDAISNIGQNQIININKNDYFSFSCPEIALVTNENYYILICDFSLWDKVKRQVKKSKSMEIIKKWWIKLSKTYEIADRSDNFRGLE